MSEYNKIGRVSLWNNTKGGDKAPVLTGTLQLDTGTELRISLWPYDGKSPTGPKFSGSIEEVSGE